MTPPPTATALLRPSRRRLVAGCLLSLLPLLVEVPAFAVEAASESGATTESAARPDARTVERLVAVGKLWGEVKLFHPALIHRDIDWDRALLETLPRVEAAESTESFRAAVEHLMSFLEDPDLRLVVLEDEEEDAPDAAADNGEEGGGETPQEGREPTVEPLGEEGFVRIDATDYPALTALGRWQGGLFTAAFEAAAEAPGVVLDLRDLRHLGASRGRPQREDWAVAYVLQRDLPRILPKEILLPSDRVRFHNGYAPQRPGFNSSGGYYSGVLRQEHERLAPAENAQPLTRLVILTNEGTGAALALVATLRLAGLAKVVHQGDPGSVPLPGGLHNVDLAGELQVGYRVSETVLPGGSGFLLPDRTVTGGDTAEKPVISAALELLRDEDGDTEAAPHSAEQDPPASPSRRLEKPYADTPYPSREMRMLALFRYWSVIDRFFPYKHLLDHPWDDVLPEMLSRFAEAGDEVEYVLAVAEMMARTQDSHSVLRSEVWSRWVGTHHPPFLIDFVEGRPVVVWVSPEAGEARGGVEVGDVIVEIDGAPERARRQELTPYVAASTLQALNRRLEVLLLAGAENSRARLRIEGADGALRDAEVVRDKSRAEVWGERRAAESEPVWKRLPEGYGFVDLMRLTRDQVPEMFEELRDTPALILDLRGYPRGTAWAITPYLAAESETAARFRRLLHLGPGGYPSTALTFQQTFPAGGPWQYDGRLVVLINENAISQSEHTCLFFESAYDDVTFVGTPTNGTNGDVTSLPLPGGIWVNFTGHDVRHADGRQLQRVGIQPDIVAKPTIDGVRAGRDEVLEAALQMLR